MSSSVCFIPLIYRSWENNEFSFLLSKEKQRNFQTCNSYRSNCYACECSSKTPFIKNKACDNHTFKENMVCVDACKCHL